MLRVSTLIHMYSLWDFLFIFLLLFVHLIVLSRRRRLRRLMFFLEKKFFNMNEKRHILKSEHQTLGYFP